VPKAFRGGLDLSEGSEWEGQVEESTDFGCFVRLGRLGVQRHRGLLHVSGLSEERLEPAAVPDYVEETVGPVGSKVRVLVRSLEYKGRREALPCHDSLAQPAPVILSRRPVGLESRCSSSRCSRGRARASCQSGRSCGAWRRARRGAEVQYVTPPRRAESFCRRSFTFFFVRAREFISHLGKNFTCVFAQHLSCFMFVACAG